MLTTARLSGLLSPSRRKSRLPKPVVAVSLAGLVAAIVSLLLVSIVTAQGGPSALLWLDASAPGSTPGVFEDSSGDENHGTMVGFDDPSGAFGSDASVSYLAFDGVDDYVVTSILMAAPETARLEVMFRTTVAGGKIAGFESTQAESSGSFDRHMYVDMNGYLQFGAWNGGSVEVVSAVPVNDGEWHTAVGIIYWDGQETWLQLILDGSVQAVISSTQMVSYEGYFRMGGGNLNNWEAVGNKYFNGDIAYFRVTDAVGIEEGATPTPLPPTVTSTATPTVPVTPTPVPPTQEPTATAVPQPSGSPTPPPGSGGGGSGDGSPRVGVSGDVSSGSLRLDITTSNITDPNALVYVVRDDGEEWLVGPAAAELTWSGEPVSATYRVEARVPSGVVGAGDTVVAAVKIPVFATSSGSGEIIFAVGVGVAVATVASVGASGAFNASEFGQRVLRFFLTEKVRKRTKRFDRMKLRSWHAVVVSFVLMAALIALGRPGALRLQSLGEALLFAGLATVLFRLSLLLGQVLLSFLADRKPRYLVWVAGSLAMAITSIALHTPVGYTGYVDRAPSDKAREARFSAASLGAILAVTGLFALIGITAHMVFAETGIAITVGALGVSALPFSGLGGNAIWKWSAPVSVFVAAAAFVPYFMFQYGALSVGALLALGVCGTIVFWTVAGIELWQWWSRQTRPAPEPALQV